MTNGTAVASLEAAWAERVGAKYAIALCNGTATLHTALAVLGAKGRLVHVPAITMASTGLAVLHAGGTPVYADVDRDTWLMQGTRGDFAIPVDLYGLHYPPGLIDGIRIVDAAQSLRPHDPRAAFTSYSLQDSKIINVGQESEGGVLVTDDKGLWDMARSFSSLGYKMDGPRIDKAAIKHPEFLRHHVVVPGDTARNYRMPGLVAAAALKQLRKADVLLKVRQDCASMYATAINGCAWLKPQDRGALPHDYWTYAVALDSGNRWERVVAAIERNGGERPYAAWRPLYREPALSAAANCPNADSLQLRLLQFQTNDLQAAERNARALMAAIAECG